MFEDSADATCTLFSESDARLLSRGDGAPLPPSTFQRADSTCSAAAVAVGRPRLESLASSPRRPRPFCIAAYPGSLGRGCVASASESRFSAASAARGNRRRGARASVRNGSDSACSARPLLSAASRVARRGGGGGRGSGPPPRMPDDRGARAAARSHLWRAIRRPGHCRAYAASQKPRPKEPKQHMRPHVHTRRPPRSRNPARLNVTCNITQRCDGAILTRHCRSSPRAGAPRRG